MCDVFTYVCPRVLRAVINMAVHKVLLEVFSRACRKVVREVFREVCLRVMLAVINWAFLRVPREVFDRVCREVLRDALNQLFVLGVFFGVRERALHVVVFQRCLVQLLFGRCLMPSMQ